MDSRREDFLAAVDARFSGVDPADAPELSSDYFFDPSTSEAAAVDALLDIGGGELRRATQVRDGIEAVYEIEAWGRSETIVVRFDPDGLAVSAE